jgi:peptidoglycan LD-endopeptidase LytH
MKKYLLLAGICITFQAFMMKPFEQEKYCTPQLPEEICNTEPKINRLPSFIIPVIGATCKSIISFYGDARDNGRKHEGIDIVAPKGTFVIAPSEGVITSVRYNSLGGKVIWMKDAIQKRSYYFAHLDSQIVSKGMMVKRGDTLGTVGNTGNARRTRSHLHFGIYNSNGRTPVDYIRTKEQVISLLASE